SRKALISIVLCPTPPHPAHGSIRRHSRVTVVASKAVGQSQPFHVIQSARFTIAKANRGRRPISRTVHPVVSGFLYPFVCQSSVHLSTVAYRYRHSHVSLSSPIVIGIHPHCLSEFV